MKIYSGDFWTFQNKTRFKDLKRRWNIVIVRGISSNLWKKITALQEQTLTFNFLRLNFIPRKHLEQFLTRNLTSWKFKLLFLDLTLYRTMWFHEIVSCRFNA